MVEDNQNTTTKTMLPEGNYKVVSFALDLTGKKLIDEICHIGAFAHPDHVFSQYVMPYRDVSRSSTRAHGIRVFTSFGRFRVLKDTRSMKTLRTKSEYSTLIEFIEWMKKVSADNPDGIILAYHDNHVNDIVPFFMEALRRFRLSDDFFAVVKGFVNSHTIAMDHLEQKDRPISLRSLLRKVLEFDEEKLNSNLLESAKKRAQLTYEVMAKMFNVEGEISSDMIRKVATGKDEELVNLDKQIVLARKVKSLRPIFVSQIRKGPKERSRAVVLRRYLIDIGTDYENVRSAFETGSRDGLLTMVGVGSSAGGKKKKQDMEDLVDLIVAHFTGNTKADVNANITTSKKEIGAGEPRRSSEEEDEDNEEEEEQSSGETDDDEFEEAKDGEYLDIGTVETEI